MDHGHASEVIFRSSTKVSPVTITLDRMMDESITWEIPMRCSGTMSDDRRGFHIFDTETLEHTPVDNPYRLFYNIYYEDTNHQLFDSREYENKIVKVIVRKKTDTKSLKSLLINLYSDGVAELKL